MTPEEALRLETERHWADYVGATDALQQAGSNAPDQALAYAALARAIVRIDEQARKGSVPDHLSPDPDWLLDELLKHAHKVLEADTDSQRLMSGKDMITWWIDLAQWLKGGGRPPQAWQQNPREEDVP